MSDGSNPFTGTAPALGPPNLTSGFNGNDWGMTASPTGYKGRIYAGYREDDYINASNYLPYVPGGTGAYQQGTAPSSALIYSTATDPESGETMYNVVGTPAVDNVHGKIITADVSGYVYGYGINGNTITHTPTDNWSSAVQPLDPNASPVGFFASPVVADTSAGKVVYLAGEDQAIQGTSYVFALNASDGSPTSPAYLTDSSGNPLDGKLRASMAAYNGRLYVLTTNGKIYCYGASS